MASRYKYWTIILSDGPTSFRARDRDSLVPTLKQLQSRDPGAALKWFANGRLWDSPDHAHEYARLARIAWKKTRGPEWRPGGEHRDPRDRSNKKKGRQTGRRAGPAATGTAGAGSPARDGRQRRPYRPTGGTDRRGGRGGGRGSRGGGGGRR